MRAAFAKTVAKIAKTDPRIVFLTGDLGYSALEPVMEAIPERFLNMGIAEQNMASFAAGLALSGKLPIIYSIATFATLKTIEQIRNDICYQNLNVKIVGTGSGLTYSQYGATHQSVDDIALMRVLPNMKVICPADPVEVEKAVEAMLNDKGPCYLRIGGKGEPRIHNDALDFQIGKGIVVKQGAKVALLVCGNMLDNTLNAAELLGKQALSPEVISMHTVKPLDLDLLGKVFANFQYVFTIEEHSLIGGLGSAVAEMVSELPKKSFVFRRIGVADKFQETSGWLDYIREQNGLSPDRIADTVLSIVKNDK